jgi:hypothetical protein
MGMHEVIDGLAPGKCVEYHGVDGLIVVYEPYFHIVGASRCGCTHARHRQCG